MKFFLRITLLLVIVFIFQNGAKCALLGNEWIAYNQKYLEIKITDTGIYRINYTVLEQALTGIGESVYNIDPRNIQIWSRGEEQYIYIDGENDGSFDSTDFVEFFAVKNDGWFDSLLYETSSEQSNPYYSLFNDTATYFLTVAGANGKRMSVSNSVNFSAFTPAQFFFREEIVSFVNQYLQGEYTADGAYHPLYRNGEGWFSAEINSNGSTNFAYTFSNLFQYTSNPSANVNLKIIYAGINASSHNIRISYNSAIINDAFTGFLLRKHDTVFSASNIPSGITYKTITPSSNTTERTAISLIYMKYPRTFNLSSVSQMLLLLPSSSDTTFINPFNFSSAVNFFYDLTSHVRIHDSISGTNHKALIPPADAERKIFASNQIKNVSALIPATANNGVFTDFSSVPDSAFLIITHKILWNEASQYAAYKNNSFLADINELYNQFSYGIGKHPLAIRNFCGFLMNKSPRHLFLIGKGISDAVFSTRNDTYWYEINLIPTYGYPASDVAFTAGLNGLNRTVPAIPTGRLAAKNGQEVLDYLSKVQQFDAATASENNLQLSEALQTIPNRLWLKQAIHFCGGKDDWENTTFCSYVKDYENLFEKDLYGGFVTGISKNTGGIVNLTDSIRDKINNGVSLITFFGHSSGSISEINIGSAVEYENTGKYPLIIVNGCLSGDIFTISSESTSEDFVLEKQKGAIAYIAHAGLGYPPQLHTYTRNLYENIAQKTYHESVGKCIQQGIAGMWQTDTGFTGIATMLGMTLHGDPSLKVNTHAKPDYAIAPEYVFFSPQEVTTADDSFSVNIVIFNLGKAITDSLSVIVRRTFQNGASVTYNALIPPVFYSDTFSLKLPVDAANGAGQNKFFIMVEANDSIDEIAELNNIIDGNNSIELIIKSGELAPVYPYNFAVVPNRKIALTASTSEFFAAEKEYLFQMDTTDLYNSQKLRQYTVTSKGGVVKWNIDTTYFNLPDSTVFFWRTSPNTPNDYKWREHSFQVISGKEGWGQKHFFQLKNNDFKSTSYKKNEREIQFFQKSATLQCNILGHPQNDEQYAENEYKIDAFQIDYNSATRDWPAMYVAIIDSCSLEPWGTKRIINLVVYNPENDFGQINQGIKDVTPGRWWTVEYYFVFLIQNAVQMDSLRNLLNDKIPNGNYILAYCFGSPLFQDSAYWKESHKKAFQDLGATAIMTASDTTPYIFIGQKGNPAFAKEKTGTLAHEYISLSAYMSGCNGRGYFTSPVIGPAYSWGSLHWNFNGTAGTDSVNLEIMDAGNNNQLKSFATFSGDVFQLNDSVSNKNFKLRANLKDVISNSPPAFNYWYVFFDDVPEAALDSPFDFYAVGLQQGDSVKFNVAIENVSHSDMDSLRIKYWIVTATNAISATVYKKKDSLLAGEITRDTISFSTKNITGNCRFFIEVNPLDSLWQPEQYHFNNTANASFSVTRDNTNPLLDVTFDGVRILNGDIVSPSPEIIIQLKDENKFLAMDDTSDFKILITDPEEKTERIYFTKNGMEQMRFSKATLPENKCKIEWKAKFAKDGIYKLTVQGSDASDNNSGDMDYAINFEVISKSSITEALNYPNPFSSSTQFVFTLTGTEIPDYFKIQILTVSGKIIREITRAELGNIRIGRNITEYAWNGTDEFGDPLANGVYLYRVIAKISGEDIEHRQTGADSFFKKGFGKMYLMR